jgi:hypothetical protein
MPNFSQRVGIATQAAMDAFRRVYANPEAEQQRATWQSRSTEYRVLWAWYNNSVFEDVAAWSAYRATYKLPRHIRPIYNPTRRLVDFYAGTVYPGVLTDDGQRLPDGVSLAIPFPDDTDQRLVEAVAQLWRWSNWQSGKSVMVRYGAALGNAFVEIVDDTQRGKVYLVNRWPGMVADLTRNSQGDVKAYALEYMVEDASTVAGVYLYRREVTPDVIRTYRDDRLFDYNPELGLGPEWPNPYGFAPAVWVPHIDLGGDYGAPAIHGALGKLDELNATASIAHDQIRKLVQAPILIATDDDVSPLLQRTKRGRTADLADAASDRESIPWIKAGMGTQVHQLAGNLDLSGAILYMQELMGELENDFPELSYYRQMREMSTVTGPAASRLVGDVMSKVYEASANYDRASIAAFQMALAIGGWRLSQGDWGRNGPVTVQQRRFAPFDLTSYARGELDFTIAPRPLIIPTENEKAKEAFDWWQAASQATTAGLPLEIYLKREMGWSDKDIAEIKRAKMDAFQFAQEFAVVPQDVPPDEQAAPTGEPVVGQVIPPTSQPAQQG